MWLHATKYQCALCCSFEARVSFHIRDITVNDEYDFMNIYVALDVLQAFLDREGEVTGIEIRIKDPDNTAPVLRAVRKILPDSIYRVQDWQEINRSLFSALKLDWFRRYMTTRALFLSVELAIGI